MKALVKNMCFLACLWNCMAMLVATGLRLFMDHTIKTRLLLQPVRSALGTIHIGGLNKMGAGVGAGGEAARTLSCYGFNYVLSGRGLFVDARGRSQPVNAGDAALFFPGVVHRCFAQEGDTWDELWFEFEGPVFDLLRRGKGARLLDPARPVRPVAGDGAAWVKRFLSLVPPPHLRGATPTEAIVARFVALLAELLGGQPPDDSVSTNAGAPTDWAGKARALLVDDGSGAKRTPAETAKKLGVSYESFRKKFRAEIGFSPGRFQLDARIDRAAALLYEGRLSVKEIAAQLGFCDEFYFSRCFKRRFGESPRQFRVKARRVA